MKLRRAQAFTFTQTPQFEPTEGLLARPDAFEILPASL
jgi:hypothetical protein